MDQPSEEIMDNCLSILTEMKCLSDSEIITPYGLEVSRIPLPPVFSHLLIQSDHHKCSALMLNVLSILSVDNLFYANREDK